MGIIIDSILGSVSATTSGYQAVTLASNNSLTVRSFNSPAFARLDTVMFNGNASVAATQVSIRITSPMLHDDVRGIQIEPGTAPTQYLLPRETGQRLYSQDTLAVAVNDANASVSDSVVLSVYYSNLTGQSARLHSWGDISGNIKYIKPLEVDVSAGTLGAWQDTVITADENLLHANTDYAVLGILTDTDGCSMGVMGSETGNFRVTTPMITSTIDTSDYYVMFSERMGTPHIPVFNSANKDSFYVTTTGNAAAARVQLILAEMNSNLTS
jgi:hypothetical protein